MGAESRVIRSFVYGLGGYCEDCDDSHDHPLHNLVEVLEVGIEIVDEDAPTP